LGGRWVDQPSLNLCISIETRDCGVNHATNVHSLFLRPSCVEPCEPLVCVPRVQRGYLEKSLDALKRKSAKDATVFASDRSKLLRENSIVTTEINALRYGTRRSVCTGTANAPLAGVPSCPPHSFCCYGLVYLLDSW
jgi:hypothetical protein